MSGVTKGQLEAQNAELLEVVKNLERMNDKAMALARRARHDTDDAEADVIFYRQQRDRLIGFLQGYRKDIDQSIASPAGAVMAYHEPEPVSVSRVDAFLGQCQEEPAVHNTAERRQL